VASIVLIRDEQLTLWPEEELEELFRPVETTRSLRDHPARLRILRMVTYVLRHFPELQGTTLRVGLTRGADGRAAVGKPEIWLNPRGLSYHTIAHELVHVLQGPGRIPCGERSADLFALARHHTLVDTRPTYVRVPSRAFDHRNRPLPGVARLVWETAREAVGRRAAGQRRYIAWFEGEVARRLEALGC
jgi:hypothetical protein